MKTEEGNKLIAEFLGAKCHKGIGELKKHTYAKFPDNSDECGMTLNIEKLKYHYSWDWLMPVVKRIRLGLGGDSYWFDHFNEALDSVDIEKIWMATVGFIKWNNEQK